MRQTMFVKAAQWALVMGQLIVVAVAIRAPDRQFVADFFSGSHPTMESTAAATTALVWLASLTVACVFAVVEIRHIRMRRPTLASTLVLALLVGTCSVCAGLVRQQTAEFHPTAGSLAEAAHLAEGSR